MSPLALIAPFTSKLPVKLAPNAVTLKTSLLLIKVLTSFEVPNVIYS